MSSLVQEVSEAFKVVTGFQKGDGLLSIPFNLATGRVIKTLHENREVYFKMHWKSLDM